MNDNYFLDSNILIYSQGNEPLKKETSLGLLKDNFYISTQVVNEFINARVKKFNDDKANAFKLANDILELCNLVIIDKETFKSCEVIFIKYGYSFYDSMIISAALKSECAILYSEDLSHNQIIEKKLKIVNPFK